MAVEGGLLACQVLVGAVGYVLLYAFGLADCRRADLRLLGLSYLLGFAYLGVVLSVVTIAGLGPSVPVALVVAALTAAGSVLVGRRAAGAEVSLSRGEHPVGLAVGAAGAVLIGVVAVAGIAVARATQWNAATEFDAFWFWIPRAETIYYAHGLDAGLWGSLPDPARPPLLSVMDALAFHFAGGVHPSLLITQRTLLGIAFLFSAASLLGRVVPRWLALPTVAAIGAAPWLWSRLGSPMADLTVTYLIGVGALACVLWLRDGRARWLALAVVLLGAATLTKSEGQIFAALLVVTVLVAGAVRYGRAAVPVAWLVLAPLVFLPWRLWLGHHGLPTSMSDFRIGDALHWGFLSARADRLSYALAEMRRTGVKLAADALGGWGTSGLGGWILSVPLVAGLVVAARRVPLLVTAVVGWFALAYFGLATTYWIARPNVAYYMNITVRRVEPTIVAASILLVALVVGSALPRREAAVSTSRLPGVDRVLAVIARSRLAFWLAPVAALLLVAGVADTRPAVSRAGRVDVPTVERELAAQLEHELLAQTYPYDLTAECGSTSPDGLDYACVLTTTGPVGIPPKVLTWNETVSCEPGPTDLQRCASSAGDALD